MIVKEALAGERPVVATDVGDIQKCYGELPGVLLTDGSPEDVAARLEEAVAVAAKGPFGGRARLKELQLDLDQVARRVKEVYDEVAGLHTANIK